MHVSAACVQSSCFLQSNEACIKWVVAAGTLLLTSRNQGTIKRPVLWWPDRCKAAPSYCSLAHCQPIAARADACCSGARDLAVHKGEKAINHVSNMPALHSLHTRGPLPLLQGSQSITVLIKQRHHKCMGFPLAAVLRHSQERTRLLCQKLGRPDRTAVCKLPCQYAVRPTHVASQFCAGNAPSMSLSLHVRRRATFSAADSSSPMQWRDALGPSKQRLPTSKQTREPGCHGQNAQLVYHSLDCSCFTSLTALPNAWQQDMSPLLQISKPRITGAKHDRHKTLWPHRLLA